MKKVRVSATSANLGAGFDCMGLALNLYNEASAEESDRLLIEAERGFPADESNLVYRSVKQVYDLCGRRLPGLILKQTSRIPPASGLGSSAACVAAGVSLGNALLGGPLPEAEIVNLCARLDGHPDNVVPALLGGVSAGLTTEDGRVEYVRCDAPEFLLFLSATPPYGLSTARARAVLPDVYSRCDVVYSLSRAVVAFAALVKGETEKLRCIDDKLHQPYRIPLIPGYGEAAAAFEAAGCLAHYISGAGPTLIGLFSREPAELKLPDGWTARRLHAVNHGLTVTED